MAKLLAEKAKAREDADLKLIAEAMARAKTAENDGTWAGWKKLIIGQPCFFVEGWSVKDRRLEVLPSV